jgi:hypothetical protein
MILSPCHKNLTTNVSPFFYEPIIQFSGIFGLAVFFLELQDSAAINSVACRAKILINYLDTET